MTTPEGLYTCARCGADCGNGSVMECVIVSDLDAEHGIVVNMRFCRARWEGGVVVKGCDSVVFGPAAIKALRGESPVHQRPIRGNPPPPPEIGQEPIPVASEEKARESQARREEMEANSIKNTGADSGPVESNVVVLSGEATAVSEEGSAAPAVAEETP